MPYLYPTIGLRTRGEGVEANFGFAPFQFNIAQYVCEQQERVLKKVNATPLPLSRVPPQTAKSALLSTPTTLMTGKHKKKKKHDHQWHTSHQTDDMESSEPALLPNISDMMEDTPPETPSTAGPPNAVDEPITSEEQLMASIVCRYLAQSGYLETARSLKRSAGLTQQRDWIDTEENYHRRGAILSFFLNDILFLLHGKKTSLTH